MTISCSAFEFCVASVRVENVTFSVRSGAPSELLVLNVTGICTGFPPVKPTLLVQSAADWREVQNVSGTANPQKRILGAKADSHGIVRSEFSIEAALPWSLSDRPVRVVCANRFASATGNHSTLERALLFF